MRVYALYQNSWQILIFFLALSFAALPVDGVCKLWSIAFSLTHKATQSGHCFLSISLQQISRFHQNTSAAHLVHI